MLRSAALLSAAPWRRTARRQRAQLTASTMARAVSSAQAAHYDPHIARRFSSVLVSVPEGRGRGALKKSAGPADQTSGGRAGATQTGSDAVVTPPGLMCSRFVRRRSAWNSSFAPTSPFRKRWVSRAAEVGPVHGLVVPPALPAGLACHALLPSHYDPTR